jgi:hypothetical protein
MSLPPFPLGSVRFCPAAQEPPALTVATVPSPREDGAKNQREADARLLETFPCNCDRRDEARSAPMRDKGEHWLDCPKSLASMLRSQP